MSGCGGGASLATNMNYTTVVSLCVTLSFPWDEASVKGSQLFWEICLLLELLRMKAVLEPTHSWVLQNTNWCSHCILRPRLSPQSIPQVKTRSKPVATRFSTKGKHGCLFLHPTGRKRPSSCCRSPWYSFFPRRTFQLYITCSQFQKINRIYWTSDWMGPCFSSSHSARLTQETGCGLRGGHSWSNSLHV